MTEFHPDIISGKTCPYCGKPTELIDSAEIYSGTSYGYIYVCRPCNAYVGCHHGTTHSFGRLANEELRQYKHCAHEIFDLIWQNKHKSRFNAYTWLQQQLHLDRRYTHIGMFDTDYCKIVIERSRDYILKKDAERYTSQIDETLRKYKVEI